MNCIIILGGLVLCMLIVLLCFSEKENYACAPIYVGYNQLCDSSQCKTICEPNRYECSLSTGRCEYKTPQPNGEVCKEDGECKSLNCYFDASGKNTGIGVCKPKSKKV